MPDNLKLYTFAKVKSLSMQVQKEDIRGRILAVARQQFERKGYSKTSMREIAELSGVGVGNIYNYFTNKDELFREVVRPVLCALEAMLQEHHGIRGEDIMMMRSEKYLKSCIDEYVSLVVPCARFLVGTLPRELYRPFYGIGQGMVRVHAAKASRNQYGGVRLHHTPAYGMDVHDVRGTADAFRTPAGNGSYLARLHTV